VVTPLTIVARGRTWLDTSRDVHVAIQDAMGWLDRHLHEFRIARSKAAKLERLGIPDPNFPDECPCAADWEAHCGRLQLGYGLRQTSATLEEGIPSVDVR
jgi:hypothetical protein